MAYDGTITLEDPNLLETFELDEQTTAYVLRDIGAECPDWEGIGYVVQVSHDHPRYDSLMIPGDHGDAPLDVDAIRAAWDRFKDHELVARYLRMWHDAVSVDYSTGLHRDANVYAVVTRSQAAAWGVDLGLWGSLAGPALDTYRAWAEGEALGIIVVNTVTGEENALWGVYARPSELDAVARDLMPIGVAS